MTTEEITWDALKTMLKELIEQTKETDRLIRELRESGKETDRRLQETELQIQETARRLQETDGLVRELRESNRETDRRMQETDRLIRELRESGKETDRQMQETDRRMRELQHQLGRLGNRLGDFVESMVQPAVVELFQGRGLPVHQVMRRVVALDDQRRVLSEIDLLAINEEAAVGVECKLNATVEDVRTHLERMGRFKRDFPHFAGLRLFGAIALGRSPRCSSRRGSRPSPCARGSMSWPNRVRTSRFAIPPTSSPANGNPQVPCPLSL